MINTDQPEVLRHLKISNRPSLLWHWEPRELLEARNPMEGLRPSPLELQLVKLDTVAFTMVLPWFYHGLPVSGDFLQNDVDVAQDITQDLVKSNQKIIQRSVTTPVMAELSRPLGSTILASPATPPDLMRHSDHGAVACCIPKPGTIRSYLVNINGLLIDMCLEDHPFVAYCSSRILRPGTSSPCTVWHGLNG